MKFVYAGLILAAIVGFLFWSSREKSETLVSPALQRGSSDSPTPTPTPQAKPDLASPDTPTPTPKPLTFGQMNALYGPCVDLPILMYHHVQEYEVAKTGGYSGLTVTPETFEKQLAYLNDRKYNSVSIAQLIAFFDGGTPLPKKPVLLTFDDGYDDFATFAAPLLAQYSIKASVYLPTGLMENSGYLSWDTIASLNNQGIYFGNHTWSHRNMGTSLETIKKEITTGQTQLADHGLNQIKTFVYPYGTVSKAAINFLSDSGYALAFTTVPGRTECQKQRLTLPRIRIGNGSLSTYGL